MLKELFINVCILVTFLFIGGILFKKYPYIETVKQKLLFGFLTGLLGSLLMFFSIQLAPGIIMDFRHFAILLATLYGGAIPAIVSLIIILVNRILFINASSFTITIVLIVFLIVTIGAVYIGNCKTTDLKKWMAMVGFSMFLLTGMFFLLLGSTKEIYKLMVIYWTISVTAGLLVFLFANYIYQSNKAYLEMKQQSTTDFLTGLNNVRQFDAVFISLLEQGRQMDQKLTLLMIDIDHFKTVNDTYGHAAGDEILRQVGELLRLYTRSHDIISRNGGEEFTVLLPDCVHSSAVYLAERLRFAVEQHCFVLPDLSEANITISVGVATYLETVYSAEHLLKQADDALYKAKFSGRNKVCSSVSA